MQSALHLHVQCNIVKQMPGSKSIIMVIYYVCYMTTAFMAESFDVQDDTAQQMFKASHEEVYLMPVVSQ